MASVSDISIEFAHLYLANLDERSAQTSARAAKRWLTPVIAAYEDAGQTVSTVVMVDDYFAPEGTDIEDKVRILQEACQEVDLRIDHLAFEADCAESIERMRTRLRSEPREGDGSSSPPPRDVGSDWLSNSDPPRGQSDQELVGRLSRMRLAADDRPRANGRARGHHSIHLDVQLWKTEPGSYDRLWACPSLAAWWQLIRLGMLHDGHTDRPTSPRRTRSLGDAPPLPARRTLTLLDSRFLEVEHAVRTILERVSLPERWRRFLRDGEAAPSSHEHLERIAYIFVPSGFEPRA